MFVLNLKAYPNALGAGASAIGEELARRATARGVPAALAPSASDLSALARSLPIPILAQHVDPIDAGARTGSLVAEAVAASGARGSLVNHSERPLDLAEVADVVGRLGRLGLVPIVCAPNVEAATSLAVLTPAYLAVEPPELIGGDRSVSTARPEVISGTVDAVRAVSPNTRVLCGAGIHTSVDVRRALELGAEGILVSSAVARAVDPGRAIAELLAGFPG